MKNGLQLLVTGALFAAGAMTASADRYYQRGDEPVAAEDIKAGVQYVLNCAKPDNAGEKTFLNGTTFSFGTENLTLSCVYTFESAGTNTKGEPVYYLKNSEGKYFSMPGRELGYTDKLDYAWKVTVKAVNAEFESDYEYSATTEDGDEEDLTGMAAYRAEYREQGEPLDLSNASFFGDSEYGVVIAGAEPDDATDICSTYTYLLGLNNGAATGNVNRGTNYNTNVWVVYTAEQQSAEAYLEAVINELFPSGWDPDQYTTGNTPGDYSQEAIDAMTEAYENAMYSVSEENAEELAEALKKAYADFEASFVSFQPGYYVFCTARDTNGGAMYDNTGNVDGDTGSSYAGRTVNGLKWCWSSSNPDGNANHTFKYDASLEGDEWCAQAGLKYMVWEVIATSTKNRYYFKNWATGNYIHVIKTNNTQVPVVAEPTEEDLYTMEPNPAYTYEDADGQTRPLWMFFNDNNWVNPNTKEVSGIHAAGDYANTVAWGKSTEGSSWTIRTVTLDELERITVLGRQPELNKNLTDLVTEAEQFVEGTKIYDIFDAKTGKLANPHLVSGIEPEGLVTSEEQITANSIRENDGQGIAGLIDGDFGTYYHSTWDDTNAPEKVEIVDPEDPEGLIEVYPPQYLAFDLLNSYKDVTIKWFSRKAGDANAYMGLPATVRVSASNDGENWEVVSEESEFVYGPRNNDHRVTVGEGEDAEVQTNVWTGYLPIHMEKAYQHVRFELLSNVRGVKYTQSTEHYPSQLYMNASEVRVYEGILYEYKYDVENSPYEAIPAEVVAELDKQLETAAAELEDETATEETIDALQKAFDAFKAATPNPQSLRDLITTATGIANSAEVGNEPGYFTQDAIDALKKAIADAEGKYKGSMTVVEITDAKDALQAAIDAFQDALLKPANGIYMIQSKSMTLRDGELVTNGQTDAYLYSQHNSTVDNVNHGWTGDNKEFAESVLGAYWNVEKVEGGFTFKNLYTGLYLAPVGPDSEAMSQSAEPYVFALQFAQEPGCFNFVIAKEDAKNETYIYMNAQPSTGNVVTWTSAQGRDNSAWAFEAVDAAKLDKVVEEGFVYNLEIAAKPQIAVFPVDLYVEGIEDVKLYTVIGQDADMNIQLKETEEVVAGQAYILIPEVEGKTVRLFTDAETVEDLVPVNELKEMVNGLVPVFESQIVPADCGIFMPDHSKVVYSEASNADKVRANSGYFNVMPSTTEEGDAFIPSAGEFADGIQNIITNSDMKKGIYNLSGVRVNSMKNLPAGLYIINGKKYIVK